MSPILGPQLLHIGQEICILHKNYNIHRTGSEPLTLVELVQIEAGHPAAEPPDVQLISLRIRTCRARDRPREGLSRASTSHHLQLS